MVRTAMSLSLAEWKSNMNGYGVFSEFYDILTEDVDYKGRAEYLYGLFKRFDRVPTLMLDLACGTGSFSNEFSEKGIEVIGVDASEDMLSRARQNTEERGNNVLYLCQPAEELELYGTVDGAVCCLDSLNHITDYENFSKAIEKVSLFLEKDRLFIFDMNTEYKQEYVLSDKTFILENDDIYCVWQNFYSADEKMTEINLDFFVKQGDRYERYSEDFCERAYTQKEIENALKNAGLKLEAVFGDMSYEAPADISERNIYVARKV